MDTRKEVILSDLRSQAEPKANLSDIRELYKWEFIPYETVEYSGIMLAAMKNVKPEPVVFSPKLAGWYKIYVCMGSYGSLGSLYINLQLTNDKTFSQICPDSGKYGYFEEVYWKCADMSGQDITLSKFKTGCDHVTMLAWLRFIPMGEAEIAEYKYNQVRIDTKRIYATHDMHGHMYMHDPQTIDDWYCIVENYRDSDVYSLSMENISVFDGNPSTGRPETQGYFRYGDRYVQANIKKTYTFDMLNHLVRYGQDMGMKMYLSMRMGAWGMEFPYDKMYFENSFLQTHKELRCVDRTGTPVEAMSYIYPEVQDYICGEFIKMASTDCDGVEMIFTRGVPYVLFEKPFVDLFKSRYDGLDPRLLPIADPRVHMLHCEIMTGFVSRLRKRLDDLRASGGRKRVKLIARVHASIENGRLVGIEVAEWARKKLIDIIVSYPMFITEDLDADVWQDETHTLLDPDKYRSYVQSADHPPIMRYSGFEYEKFTDAIKKYGNGDPLTEKGRIESFKALGLPVYFEILPRQMPTEEYKRRALSLYSMGAEGVSLWDTYNRVPIRLQWSMIRRLGHKDDLAHYTNGEGEYYRHIRILNISGQNVSIYEPSWGG